MINSLGGTEKAWGSTVSVNIEDLVTILGNKEKKRRALCH